VQENAAYAALLACLKQSLDPAGILAPGNLGLAPHAVEVPDR
jgi:hypothetical protein